MKRLLLFIAALTLFQFSDLNAQIFICRSGKAEFYSKAPLEDIVAKNSNVTSLLNTSNGEIVFTVPNKAFKFDKDLMEEHFNEKYMETEKYPESVFKGRINEPVDYSKDGNYPVTATGMLKIHGVEKKVTEKGVLTVKGSQISLNAEFFVMVKDYNITIPKLVFENIAEKIQVKINTSYVPFKK